MKLNREGVQLNAEERNKRNQNWATLEDAIESVGEGSAETLAKVTAAETKAMEAKNIATAADDKSTNVQNQLSTLVVQGDSSPQATQASVGADGTSYDGNLKARLDAEHNTVTAQLADLALLKGTKINPDDYKGTDAQKIQLAIDDSLNSAGAAMIEMNRVFNVTGSTLKITKGDIRFPLHFIGGGLRKDDSGFMFTSEVTNSSDIYFNHVFFLSVSGAGTVIFDAENIIRLHTSRCQFKNVDCIALSVNSHAQSIRSDNDTITGGVGYAYDFRLDAYDMSFDNITIEVRESGIRLGRAQAVRIVDGVHEGLAGTAIKVIEDSSNLTIENNYFEKNKVAHIDLSSMGNAKGVSIKNNAILGDVEGHSDTLIKWGSLVTSVETALNFAFKGRIHDASLTVLGANFIYSKNDYGLLENLNTGRIRADLIKQIPAKAAKAQEAWKAPTFLNGWVNLGAGFTQAGYYKDEFGTVHLTGLVKSGASGTAIFKLPANYSPATALNMASVSNNLPCVIKIESNGDVIAVNGSPTTWISLDPLHFRV